ncbi:MAG: hypothetical protein GY754_44485, partial [bacterium]|nr:hypothetical protein [bacterium]
ELARLNLEAGEKARRSTAFDSASHFFKFGIDLLSPDAWQNRYDLALALYTEGGESAHLSGDQESADMLLNRVIEKARTTLDKTRVYEVKVNIYIIWNRHAEALELGKEALKFLGFPMPAKADRLTILKELVKFKIKMKGQTIESLAELKILKDPEKLAATRILMHCITTSYIGQPEYFPIVVLKFLNLSLLHGNSPGTAFAYSAYGMFLCGILGKIEEGYQFAMLALGVVAKYDSVELKPKVNHIVGGFINHWKDHIRKDLPYLMEAYKYGPEAGDITFGLYGVENCVYREIFLGQPLAEAKARYAVYYDEIKASQQLDVILFFECHYQLLLNLCDENGNRELIKGDAFNEEETIPYWTGVNQRNGLGSLLGNKLFLLVLFGTYEKAVESALVQETYLDGIVSSLYIPLHFFYYSLALLLSYSNAGRKKQK